MRINHPTLKRGPLVYIQTSCKENLSFQVDENLNFQARRYTHRQHWIVSRAKAYTLKWCNSIAKFLEYEKNWRNGERLCVGDLIVDRTYDVITFPVGYITVITKIPCVLSLKSTIHYFYSNRIYFAYSKYTRQCNLLIIRQYIFIAPSYIPIIFGIYTGYIFFPYG